MKIGERIKQRRKELGLSADKLGEILGKDRSTIFRYEKGDIENLPLDILQPIAKALMTTPEYLMGWSDEKKTNAPEKHKLSEGEIKLLEAYRRLSSDTQQLLVETIDSFDSLSEEKQKLAHQMLRLILGNQ